MLFSCFFPPKVWQSPPAPGCPSPLLTYGEGTLSSAAWHGTAVAWWGSRSAVNGLQILKCC